MVGLTLLIVGGRIVVAKAVFFCFEGGDFA